jgi:hypothetical protein
VQQELFALVASHLRRFTERGLGIAESTEALE